MRVAVNIGDQMEQISLRRDLDPLERVLEQAAGATVGFIDRLAVGVEEIAELLAGRHDSSVVRLLRNRLESHQHMKVVFQETVGVGVGDSWDVTSVQLEKMVIVPLLKKQIFSVIATVIDVVVATKLEWNWL